jgi:primosomal protein N' (replication factor Y) (superfamily II helicase)
VRRIRVAVPVPALDALTYGLPDDFAAPAPGARVLVPLGKRVVTGVVLPTRDDVRAANNGERTAEGRPRTADLEVKAIIDILDDRPFLPGDVISLAEWVSEYYACGVGEAIGAAVPPRAWIESERYAQITELGQARLLIERGTRRILLDQLVDDRPVRVDTLVGSRRGARAALLALERDELLSITRPLVGSASAFRTVRVAVLTAQGHDIHAQDSLSEPTATGPVKLGVRQREALALLAGSPEGIDTSALVSRGITAPTLQRLASLGLVSFLRRRIDRDPFEHAAGTSNGRPRAVSLTPDQAGALSRLREISDSGQFAAVVLHGVTGSGKTEIYLRLAEIVVQSGKGVLVLVPEIALTPAVAGAFRCAFGSRVAIQHSGLSDGERYDQWHRIRRGDVDVIVGTRSAVFAPVGNLGLIIVDEEHDSSYKQEESPRYHGRDVAVMRARSQNALIVLGSATPSLESYHNAQSGRYGLIVLEKRVRDRPMAKVRLVNMRDEYASSGPDVIISAALAAAIRDRLDRREQAMVLLNRRGFATSVFCRQCGTTLECPNCSVTLTVHRAARRARCHYCNYSIKVPTKCTHCAGPYLEQVGFGTERVEAEIAALFPHARVARVDRDTIRRRGAIATLLDRFASGDLDILVGTQMIAKGHDFAQVTLVGVVSADVGLGLADFRAGERTFQLLTQVAGRAGRGDLSGEAIVQTIHPDHYSIRHACRQDYRSFFDEEINFRRSMRYPPVVAMINAVVKAGTLHAAIADAQEIVSALRWGGEPYRVLGPAPAPLSRLKGEHRAQFFIKGTHRSAMRRALLTALEARPEIKRRTIVDVDPMSVL